MEPERCSHAEIGVRELISRRLNMRGFKGRGREALGEFCEREGTIDDNTFSIF
jgi:hypothetical protein